MEAVNVRDLEQIQEAEQRGGASRGATLVLAGLGGAALVITAVMTFKQGEPPERSKVDPLSALVAKAKRPETTPPESVNRRDVTFPSVLSDAEHPTTALAAVKDERGHLIAPDVDPAPVAVPPPPAEKLPVVPLPAGTLLDETSVTTEPKDSLTVLARDVSTVGDTTPAQAGSEGGFQLQVASFRDAGDADKLVEELRKRGHPAYRQAAYVADRGLWHRVRVGPFKSKFSAEKYKADFDKKERMNSFLVDPDKVRRQEEIRASKLAARAEER